MTHSPEPGPPLTDEVQRDLAVALFNETWALIELPQRTAEQDRRMLITACAAALHWDAVGTDENKVISDWQVAHVASLLGYGRSPSRTRPPHPTAPGKPARPPGCVPPSWRDWRAPTPRPGTRPSATTTCGAHLRRWTASMIPATVI